MSIESKTLGSKEAEIAFSNINTLNVPDNPTILDQLLTPYRNLEQIQKIAEEAGYTGTAIMPTHRIGHEMNGDLPPETTRFILAGNQSFRGEKGLREVLQHPSPLLALKVFLTLPHNTESLKTLKIMQQKRKGLGLPAMPVTLQTPEEAQKKEAEELTRKGLILTPDNYKQLGLTPFANLPGDLKQKGIDGLALDTYQMRRQSKSPLAKYQKSIPALWENTSIVVFGLGREDLPTDYGNFSHHDLSDLYHGNKNGEIYKVLDRMREQMQSTGHVPTFVVQIPEPGLRVLTEAGGDIVTTEKAVEVHARVLKNLRKGLKS